MTFHLVVTRAFQNYVRGDIITDLAKIEEVLAVEYKHFVARIRMIKSKGQ